MLPLSPVATIALLAVLGAGAQWLAHVLRVPAILLLLATGVAVGPVAGLVDVDAAFGGFLRPFTSLAVAVILFEGGLSLRFAEIATSGAVVRNLVTIGALVTWVLATAAAVFVAGVPTDLALLLGGILVLTGPTVVVPLVRHVRPSGPSGPILRWEGILIDPIGALLALLVFEAVRAPEGVSPARLAIDMVVTLVSGAFVGAAAGLAFGRAIALHLLPERLHAPAALAAVAGVLAAADAVHHEAGLAAVTVLGIALANQRSVDLRRVVEFKEDLGTVLLALLFLALSARLPLAQIEGIGLADFAFVAILIVVVRPLAVLASTIGSRLSWCDRGFLMAMAPRGIVAAAVSSEFALQLEQSGRADAQVVTSLVFATIVGTVVVYGTFAAGVARRLGIAESDPRGLVIIGADRVFRELAKLVSQTSIPVLLVDTNPQNVQACRDLGLRAWHGSILSDRFDDEVDLAGIGHVLACSGNDEVNLLAMRAFRSEFDGKRLFQLPPRRPADSRFGASAGGHGRWLFRDGANAELLQRLAAGGYVVKATKLTEKFSAEDHARQYGPTAVPLLLIAADGSVVLGTIDAPLVPRAGSTLVALVPPAPEGVAAG